MSGLAGDWVGVLVGVLLTVGTAVFVATEFSLVALDRPTVQRLADSGDTAAAGVVRSLRSLSTQLSGAQVGITITTLVVGYIAQPAVGGLLSAALGGLGVPEGTATGAGTALGFVLVTIFSMAFGELVPQFLGISAPLGTAKVVAVPVQVFSLVVRPLIVVLNGSANVFLRWLGVEPREEISGARTPQELQSLVLHSAEAGTLDESMARMVYRSLDFAERTAADVMTPRPSCTAIDRTASAEDIVALARSTGHSRFPVIDGDWDDVDGVVHLKKAIAVPHERRPDVPVTALMEPIRVVPETMRLDPLLLDLRGGGMQLAVVVDEYGGTAGLVTLEDVVEELVGEVADEHDRRADAGRRLTDGSWSVPGMWRPDEVRDRLGAFVPDGPAYETLGGFVMAVLGHVPSVGERVEVPDWQVAVTRMDGRRVDRLRFTPVTPPTPDDGEGESS